MGPDLLAHFPTVDHSRHGLRTIIVVRAELIRDTCVDGLPGLPLPLPPSS
ncbi:hypothetical protein FHR83_006202 [Actinoplanes campanulatus]|uniref:Uncharacterized protein n=1 Tax=Actinoplanes campanulatus TaxID=113559 RepID=A0A7W5ALK9_9ACTN|nr:hypothetical protein [Actinoplanes campanulatus]GGN35575.1 hypothetical protein GCM10010109_59740 [Actinoplanes campanulatus]GID39197.1 hypothetical protein Aca09nite_57030 [Actinoplanes campanulatus]